ncbi:hypothetical protein BUALT_Bualt01G0039000 [Buddleja alternifolia]|uniref:Uncharacterized protein n=1 Tax=Buddleja alternifolia TaxID=168488 RepID=A0AAV6YA97_9LAMI|nr:hypothetical protein BUALT_Bualt01G0039000 [Buddleja alternifolia]
MEDSRNSSGGMAARNSDDQEVTSTLHAHATESKPTEWTDEKHSLYLNSMEATFVNQLYKSLDLIGRHSQKNGPSGSKSSKYNQTSTGAPSGQFKVLREGYWSKINFRRDEAEVNQEEESGVLIANPWIQHYKCSERQPIRKFQTSGAKASSTTTRNQWLTHNFRLWQQDSVGSNAGLAKPSTLAFLCFKLKEMSDQNFNNEDDKEEKHERTHEIKRTRTSTDIIPNNDQVVPFDNIVQVDEVTENHVLPED